MRRFTLLFLGMLVCMGQLLAQTRTVTGKVVNKLDSKPVENASVMVKGGTSGTSTNSQGNFSLVVPADARALVVSSVGFAPLEINITGKNSVTVEMAVQGQNLDEVVVVAYGSVKKSDFTGSAAQVSGEEFAKRPITNVTNALVGAAPGIQTTISGGAPGSSPGILIRGISSISASTAPLIVVDGVVYNGGLANIDPNDVATLTVLKDAMTTALYGSRGANGVIQITTKRGTKNRNELQFKVSQGLTNRAFQEYERVNAFEYYPLIWEAYRNSLAYSNGQPMATANQNATNGIKNLVGYNPFRGIADNAIVGTDGMLNPNANELLWADDLDWVDQATRQGTRQEYSVSYNGGNDKSDFYGSFGYTSEKGWANKSDIKRFNGRVSVNTQPVSWFKTGVNLAGSYVTMNQAPTGGIVNPFYFARYIAPIYPVYAHNPTTGEYLLDASGNRLFDYGSLTQLGLPSRPYNTGRHTIAENLWNLDYLKRNIISARTYGELIFTDYLRFTTNISADIQDAFDMGYENTQVGDGAPAGRASRGYNKSISYTFNQLLNFSKRFGDHNVTALVGHENYDQTTNAVSGSKQGQIVDGITELPNFATINSTSSSENYHRIESYLSRFGYDFGGKYFVTASARRDGNSKFSRAVRWDNFYGVGLGWRLDKEAFLENVGWIDMLKFRTSYGKVGNDAGLGNYPYQALYTVGRNNAAEPGLSQASLGNDSLTWESQKSFDLGFDFAFFKNRLNGSIEYFDKKTDGLIFDVPLPYSLGGTTGGPLEIPQNIGNLYNRGIEIQVSGDIVRGRNFNWNMTVNATTYKNKITKMPAQPKEIITGNFKLAEGQSRYDFWLRDYRGVDPADGSVLYAYNTFNATSTNFRYLDNGKGGVDTFTVDHNNAKYIYTGTSSLPDVYGSIINTFTFKNFDLSVNLIYQIGGKIYDGVYASLMTSGNYGSTFHKDILNRWQKPGDVTDVPRLDVAKTSVFGAGSTRWLVDASYIGINNMSVGFNLPKTILNRIHSTRARVFVSAENVAFFSARKGMNVGSSFSGSTGDGYSAARVVTAGVNFNF